MLRRAFLGAMASALLARSACAQGATELCVIVPDLPSGSAGTALRILQPFLEDALGRTVIVDFRPGAGGIVGLMAGARAAADGATLTVLTPAVTLAPWLSRRMDCVPADFTPLGRISFTPSVLLVGAASPWSGIGDLRAAAKAGKVMAVPAAWDWRPAQVAQAMFLARLGLAHVNVPAGSAADQLALLGSGEVDLAFAALAPDRPNSAMEGFKILAVSAPARLSALPQVPTLAESGIDISLGAWRMLAAPAGTPEGVLGRLDGALRQVMEEPAARAALRSAGLSPDWLGAAASGRQVRDEYRAAGTLFMGLGLNVRDDPSLLAAGG